MSGLRNYPVRMRHTGETVNLYTKDGADEFLMQSETRDEFKFFSSELKRADGIRKKGKKKGKLNNADRLSLKDIYEKLRAVAECCDEGLFQERVPDGEITVWLNHVVSVFQEISQDPRWSRTGTMLRHDEFLSVSCVYLFKHPVPTVKVFEDNAFFESFSALVLARKGAVLDPSFARIPAYVVGNIFSSSVNRFDPPWSPEKAFKKLEAAGILESFMLCAAVGQPDEEEEKIRIGTLLQVLASCVTFVKKRFKTGTPCGDVLRTILDGSMEVCPIVLPYLQSLLKLSNTFEEGSVRDCLDSCRYCHKTDEKHKFMQCGRCLIASYCSKECQRAHWKQHKTQCSQEKISLKTEEATGVVISRFAWDSFMDIMRTMVVESEKAGGLGMKDMLLEVDFRPDANGNVPILQEPPQFKIFSTSKYLEREAERGFSSGEELETFAQVLRNRPPLSDLLCCILFPGDKRGTSAFNKMHEDTQKVIYTEETLEACRLAFLEDNYDSLEAILKEFSGEEHVLARPPQN